MDKLCTTLSINFYIIFMWILVQVVFILYITSIISAIYLTMFHYNFYYYVIHSLWRHKPHIGISMRKKKDVFKSNFKINMLQLLNFSTQWKSISIIAVAGLMSCTCDLRVFVGHFESVHLVTMGSQEQQQLVCSVNRGYKKYLNELALKYSVSSCS